jgi:DNA-binding FadR family transcriptional regulator
LSLLDGLLACSHLLPAQLQGQEQLVMQLQKEREALEKEKAALAAERAELSAIKQQQR